MNNGTIVELFPTEDFKRNESKGANPEFKGAKAYGDIVLLCFDDGNHELKIDNITEICYEKHALRPIENKFVFIINENDEESYFAFSDLIFDRSTFKSLLGFIVNVNSKIILSEDIKKLVEQNYIYSEKIHFDFKVHKKDNNETTVINSKNVQSISALIYVFSMIALIGVLPMVGVGILENIYGENFADYRAVLLLASGIFLSIPLLNLLLALLSKYKGHLVTYAFLLLGVAGVIFAFI